LTFNHWRTALFCVLATAWAVTAQGFQDPGSRGVRSDQEILTQIEREWDAAFLHNDVSFIEQVLADEFVATYADGSRGDRARELKLAAEFDMQVDSSTLDDFSVKVYGDTAIVWFTRQLVGPSQGRRLEVTYRYFDVFVWRAGRWQCVASQSTKVT
jgi:ketosteroid isomerase-like protein